MIGVQFGIYLLCIVVVYCDRLMQLEDKMFTLQRLTFQDISMLRESVDRNFEELQRLSTIINSSLSQKNTNVPTTIKINPSELKFADTHLEIEVRRLKRGFRDQKHFFNSWREDLGAKIDSIQDTIKGITKVNGILDVLNNNVRDIKESELLNTKTLQTLSEERRISSEKVSTSLSIIRNELINETLGEELLTTCSGSVQNSETIINTLTYLSMEFNNIRLVGGSLSSAGRLEVFLYGKWGTVCDDEFDKNAAKVACRTLGFNDGVSRPEAYYGRGSGPILLDNVKCIGNEKALFSCHIDYETSDCSHSEDVGIECYHLH